MSIYELWNRELDGGLTAVTDKQVRAVQVALQNERQSTITLRLGVYCLKTTHRPIACAYCDRASIIHWGGEFLCREHWDSEAREIHAASVRRNRLAREERDRP